MRYEHDTRNRLHDSDQVHDEWKCEDNEMKCIPGASSDARAKMPALELTPLCTREQVQSALEDRGQLYIIQRRGALYVYLRVRANGTLKTWKRDASRWELPCKYGFRECFTVSNTWNPAGVLGIVTRGEVGSIDETMERD